MKVVIRRIPYFYWGKILNMKKSKLRFGFAFLLIALTTTARPKCFNLDDSIIGITANKENAFDLFKEVGQPLEGWLSVSGSPSIFPNIAGVSYPAGKQCLLLGAYGSSRAEGAAYNYNFQSGKKYKVSYKYIYLKAK